MIKNNRISTTFRCINYKSQNNRNKTTSKRVSVSGSITIRSKIKLSRRYYFLVPTTGMTISTGAISRTAPRLSAVIPRPPNRMTSIFTAMKTSCPDAIRVYANCVQSSHNDGTLEKESCDSEFKKVHECFHRLRYGWSFCFKYIFGWVLCLIVNSLLVWNERLYAQKFKS